MTVAGGGLPEPDRAEQTALRLYYEETDFLFSAEGVLKVVSVIACIVVSVLYLGADAAGCAGAGPLAPGAAVVALAAAGAAALLYAGSALQLPLYAPQLWLYADIVISAVLAVLLLMTAILSLVFCENATVIGYLRAPVGMIAAAMVVGSAVITFAEVTRRWDAARPTWEPRRPTPTEQEA